MAVKKTTKKKDVSAAPTKAEAKETAPRKKAAKKAAAPAATAPDTATTPPPAANPAKSAAPAKSGAKKAVAAPVKLTTSQHDLLKKIGEAPEPGYTVGKKIEERSIEGLLTKKLIKKGAKDKASGSVRYLISSAGKKHIGS